MRPLVAIVGRTNVGKSTLFNRLIGKRLAIVSSIPGTTRDRIYEEVLWQGKEFDLVDTGGIFLNKKNNYKTDIINQVYEAINSADLILFLVDVKEGILPADKKALEEIRKSGKNIILVANKADNQKLRQVAENLSALGLGKPFVISAIHGIGTGDLLDGIIRKLKQLKFFKINKVKDKEEELTKVAICGRPNVGKSSLFNKIVGQKRAIVSEIPGTTRDIINTKLTIDNKKYLFLDTAGLRRRTKIKKQIEYYSFLRTLRAIGDADIVLFLIDAIEKIVRQDTTIISRIIEKGKGLILVINKWDLIKNQNFTIDNYIVYLQEKLPFLSWVPVIFISAKTGKNVAKIPKLIDKVFKERIKKIRIKELNNLISKAIIEKLPPQSRKGKAKIFYSTQTKGIPPTFVIFVNDKNTFKKSYINYLENRIRDEYKFIGTPIKIILQSKKQI